MADDEDAAQFYTGLVSDAYAALKSETFDADRYADFVRESGEPALEVGCGDGHPLLALAAQGLDVDGVDSSADMIDRARTAAARLGLTPGLHTARMEDMQLDRRYACLYLAGPTFELLPDDDAAARALRSFRAHLRPGGTAMVPLWIPNPTPTTALGTPRESTDEAASTLRYTPLTERFDMGSRTRSTRVRYERIAEGKVVQAVERAWIIHWQTITSITHLAEQAGLAIRAVEPPESALTGAPGEEFTVYLG